ncbi:MAG: hypothetical protein QXX68_00865 [Candidatus Pacearchaeota archaeon]
MASISRTITSLILLLIGFNLGYFSLRGESVLWPLLIWGVIFIIAGIYILFNKKEDEIEQIKMLSKQKPTKKIGKK